MQKKLIALALAGLAAAPAFAQSNVTVYGRVDYGYMSRGGSDGAATSNGRKGEMASGIQSGSRIGFRGEEALGNGLKAIFEVESGISNDAPGNVSNSSATAAHSNSSVATGTGSSGVFTTNRHAYVGLAGNFGTVVGGRLDGVRYGIFNKYDAFAGGGIGNFTQMTTQVDRADNAIAYISPKWNGFGLTLAHSRNVGPGANLYTQEYGSTAANADKANTGDGRLYTIAGTYDNGPISLTLDYETIRFKDSNSYTGAGVTGVTNLDNAHVITAGGSYDFKVVKIAALYDVHKAEGNSTIGSSTNPVDYRAWFVSASAPYGNFLFKATYGRVEDKRNAADLAVGAGVRGDASKLGLGVNYYLSKRTNVYMDYGRISNRSNDAAYTVAPGANANGAGYGTNGWALGLAHNF
jgi:predicted porin